MTRNLRIITASLAAGLLVFGLAGCELPGAAGGKNQQDDTQKDGDKNPAAKSIHEGTIRQDEIWKAADSPHIIRGEVTVESEQGVTLKIEPGAKVHFEKGASLYVGYGSLGYLKAEGTADKPIIFTSASSTPNKGDWKTIYLGNGAAASVMTHCQIQYGGEASYAALAVSGKDNTPTVKNSIIEQSAGYGIELKYGASFKAFTGNTIKTSGSNPLHLGANEVGSLGAGNTFVENAKQAIYVVGDTVSQSATWRNFGIPYRLQGETTVESDNEPAVLRLEAGNTLEFGSGSTLYVGYSHPGALYAVGEEGKPITFTGVAKTNGSWGGIFLSTNAIAGVDNDPETTVIQHAVIEYARSGSNAMLHIDSFKPLVKNVIFRNYASGVFGIKVGGNVSDVPTAAALIADNVFALTNYSVKHPSQDLD